MQVSVISSIMFVIYKNAYSVFHNINQLLFLDYIKFTLFMFFAFFNWAAYNMYFFDRSLGTANHL